MFRYRAYNTIISSPVKLNLSISDAEDRAPDVEVHFHGRRSIQTSHSEVALRFSRNKQKLLIKKNASSLYLSDLCGRINVPPNMQDSDDQAVFFIKCIIPLLLMHRGSLMLHASAFAIGRDAYLILGPSGVGKSTLATYANSRGAEHLADDACNVCLDGDSVYVIRSGTGCCLFPENNWSLGHRSLQNGSSTSYMYGNKILYPYDSLNIRDPADYFRVAKVVLLHTDKQEKAYDRHRYFFDHFIRSILSAEFFFRQGFSDPYLRLFEKLTHSVLIHRAQILKEEDFSSNIRRVFSEIVDSKS